MDFTEGHKTINIFKKLLVFPGVFFLLMSCENDIEKIQSLTDPNELPDVYAEEVEIIYTDSSDLEMILEAPIIKSYGKVERPYMEFPEGMYVRFFDDSMKVESEIQANYAIYYNEEKLWEARGNVVAHNLQKGEKLNTEELFWDENEKTIYSNSFSRIETEDGTFYGQEGFESNQRFSRWRLKGSRGTVNIKEEPEDSETEAN
jgi:LPS export ABC transporter protein LptC